MKDLTKGNIYKTFFLFALPMVLAGVLSQCHTLVNTVLAGKLLGDDALASIGAISPLITFINSIFWGFGTGVGIYTGQLFGAGNYEKVKHVIVNNYRFISAAIVILSALLLIFRYDIYTVLKVDGDVIDQVNRYFFITIAGNVFTLFSTNCVYVINSIGDGAFPFLMSVISTVLHITLSVVSVAFLDMGVEGLAFSGVVSSVITDILYIFKLRSCFKKTNVNKIKTPITLNEVKETCKYSVSTMIQQSVMYFAGLILSPMVNGIGSAASASYAVSLRIFHLNTAVYQNSAKTVGSYTAQSYGAKKYHLLKKGLAIGFAQNLIFVLPFILVCCIFAEPVSMLFFDKDASRLAIHYTVMFGRWCMPFLVFNVVANLYHNFFRGIGHMKALLITTIVGSFARIILSWVLIAPLGIYGYYAGWVLSWLTDGAAGVIIYFFGKWRKSISFEPKEA